MDDDASAKEGTRARGGDGPGTPARELARLRASGASRDDEARARLESAALALSGELGYRRLTVRALLERSGANRSQFYRLFASRDACYAAAYGAAVDDLCEQLLGAARAAASWREGLRRALRELARFTASQPSLARGMLVEIHIAGGPAMAKRKEVFERLTRAVDSARRENESRHSPPPIAAEFILNVIEQAVIEALLHGTPDFAASVPDLAHLAVSIYFGEDPAR